MFDQVTILFSYIVDFTDICAEASAMQIVKCINAVFTCFDAVVDKYDVFKVHVYIFVLQRSNKTFKVVWDIC